MNTKRNYERQLRYFIDWLDKDWHMVTLNNLKNYKTHLEGKNLEQGSIGAYITSVKSLFTWMVKAGYLEKNPAAALEIPVTPDAQGKNLEVHAVAALFEALPSRGTAEARDRAILCLLVYAGLRAQEISSLNVGNYNGVEVNIVQAKHGSVGLVPVDAETHAALVEYLTVRWIDFLIYLFIICTKRKYHPCKYWVSLMGTLRSVCLCRCYSPSWMNLAHLSGDSKPIQFWQR